MRDARVGSRLGVGGAVPAGNPSETLSLFPHPPPAAAYVVHPHRVVAEDLRDILADLGVRDVRVVGRLGDVPIGGVALAVIAAGANELADLPHVRTWIEQAVPLVLLDARADLQALGARVAHLSQPFEPADIVAILRNLGVV